MQNAISVFSWDAKTLQVYYISVACLRKSTVCCKINSEFKDAKRMCRGMQLCKNYSLGCNYAERNWTVMHLCKTNLGMPNKSIAFHAEY